LLQQRFQSYFSYAQRVCVGFVVDEVAQRQVQLQALRFSHVNSLLQCSSLFLSEEQVDKAMESTQSVTRFCYRGKWRRVTVKFPTFWGNVVASSSRAEMSKFFIMWPHNFGNQSPRNETTIPEEKGVVKYAAAKISKLAKQTRPYVEEHGTENTLASFYTTLEATWFRALWNGSGETHITHYTYILTYLLHGAESFLGS